MFHFALRKASTQQLREYTPKVIDSGQEPVLVIKNWPKTAHK